MKRLKKKAELSSEEIAKTLLDIDKSPDKFSSIKSNILGQFPQLEYSGECYHLCQIPNDKVLSKVKDKCTVEEFLKIIEGLVNVDTKESVNCKVPDYLGMMNSKENKDECFNVMLKTEVEDAIDIFKLIDILADKIEDDELKTELLRLQGPNEESVFGKAKDSKEIITIEKKRFDLLEKDKERTISKEKLSEKNFE